MDKDGNVKVVNGKGPPKGGGKGGGKGGKAKGNGKCKDTQDSNEYEEYPERARGRKVVKCPKAGCFGCCLDGNNRPEACNKCQTIFNYGNSRAPNAGSERAQVDPPKNHHKSDETF